MQKLALATALVAVAVAAAASPGVADAALTCHQTASPTGAISTAQGLVNALSAGQTGCLRAGTYTGDVTVNKGVKLTSYGGENAIVRGRVVVTGAGAALEKLVLDGRNAGNLASPTIHAADVVLRDNDIQNVSTSAICVNVKTSGSLVPDRFLIERNRIHHCGSLPWTNLLHGLMLENGTGGIVQDNVVYSNADKGLLLYPSLQSATIRRNTVDGNASGIHFGEATGNTVVENNVVANATRRWNIEMYNLFGAGNAVRSNCVWASNTYTSRGGIQDQIENYLTLGTNPVVQPGFANRGAGDFSIAAGAGCAGYGAPNGVAGLVPDTAIESGPSGSTSSTTATFEFSSSRPGATFECRLDTGATTGTWSACAGPVTYTGTAGTTYTLNVRAKLGTVADPTPATRTWTPPTVADTTITAGPTGVTNSASPSFSFTASPSTGATFECAMDSTTAWSACTSPKAYAGLSEGDHTFRVRAVNASGTDQSPAERSFRVDTIAPNTTITSPAAGTTASPSFTFTSSETGSSFECRLDGPGTTQGSYAACTSPKAYSSLAAGTYTFYVRARDAAGNQDATAASEQFTSPPPPTCHKVAAPGTAIDTANKLHNALAAGQTGCFRAGVYGPGSQYIEVSKPNLTFRNYPGEAVTIKGAWGFIDAGSGSRVEGLKLDFVDNTTTVGVWIHGDDITFRNNDITSSDKNIICLHPSAGPDRFLIEGNRIHDCGQKVSRSQWAADLDAYNHTHGIYVQSGNGTIRNNVIYDNMTRGVQLYPNASGVTVVNNTIDGNGMGVSFDGSAVTNNVVRDNLVTNSNIEWNVYAMPSVTGPGNEVAFNCAFASSEWSDTNVNGGIQSPMPGVWVHDNTVADPGYTSRAGKDFRFGNSACAGKGAPASVANPTGFPAP
jgi:parallel beta-helix repeat protein